MFTLKELNDLKNGLEIAIIALWEQVDTVAISELQPVLDKVNTFIEIESGDKKYTEEEVFADMANWK